MGLYRTVSVEKCKFSHPRVFCAAAEVVLVGNWNWVPALRLKKTQKYGATGPKKKFGDIQPSGCFCGWLWLSTNTAQAGAA